MNYLVKLSLTLAVCFSIISTAFAGNVDIKDMNIPIPNDPTVMTGKFKNGLTYYIKENKYPENRAELQIVFKAGSLDEDDDQAGLAHFNEHMAFNGTKDFPKSELVSFFESIGMSFGGDLNANTGFDRTLYLITIPMDKPEILDKGLLILENWAHGISFAPEELEKERGVIHEEWRLYLSAQQRSMQQHLKLLLKDSKWQNRLPIGDTNVILRAPRQRFVDLYRDWYRPNMTAIVVVGDVKKEVIYEKLEKLFANIPNPENEKPKPDYLIPIKDETLASVFQDKEWSQPPMFSVYVKYPKGNKVTYNDYKTQIQNQLISNMLSMRYQELLQKPESPLAFFAAGSYDEFIGNVEAMSLMGLAKAESVNEAYKSLLGESFRAAQYGFLETELKRAKEAIFTGIEKAYNERNKTESKNLANEYYSHFVYNVFYPGIEVEKALYEKFLAEIGINELNQLIKKYMDGKSINITLSAGADAKVPTENELIAMYNEAKAKKYEPFVDNATEKPLMAKKPTKGKVTKEEKIASIDLVKWTLSNGAEVYLKKTDFKNDQILFQAYAPGGTSIYNDKDLEVAQHACSIVDEGGIAEFDKVQLQKLLTGKSISISPSMGSLTRNFRGYASPKDLETMFQLFNLYFTAPRKDAKAFEIYKKDQIQAWEAGQKDPENAFSEEFTKVLYNNHPRVQPTTKEDLEGINLDKAFEIYKNQFDGIGQFKFVFVGNIDFEIMKDMLETYIASLPKGKDMKWIDNKVDYATGTKESKVYKGVDHKSNFRVSIPGTYKYSYETDLMLDAVSDVLSIRLREEIREEKGGTYGVGAWVSSSKFPKETYNWGVSFGTAPEKLPELIGVVKTVLNDVKTGNFKDENVAKIKEQMVRKYETNLKKNNFWLGSIYSCIYNGDDFNVINNYKNYVEKIDKKTITETATKYINNNWIQVTSYPEDMKK